MNLRCLIVDDEPLSLDVLERFIAEVPGLQLAGRCQDAFEAMEVLHKSAVDLIFLDINMPRLSGLNMVKIDGQTFLRVVFTTAYPEFAVDGFELDVLDYLVKPIAFERFVKTISKAEAKLQRSFEVGVAEQDFVMIKSNKKLFRIALSAILYIQSMGDFLKVVTEDKTYISSETLRNMETQLPAKKFCRIHKSYIISVGAVQYIEGNQLKIGKEILPIGATYKDQLQKALDIGGVL
jgi:DNA-binding LytR/AlgR family response regulator